MRSVHRLVLISSVLILCNASMAQTTWWGMTANGGNADIGAIYTTNQNTPATYTKKFDLTRNEGGSPKGDLIKASDGQYWGVTEVGGGSGFGTIFSYNPTSGIYTTVIEFDGTTQGASPVAGLIQAANGKLYGMCSGGGANAMGTLFEYTIGGALVKKLDFNGTVNGRNPRGRLVQLPSGAPNNSMMVGVTQLGGANNNGVIFTVSSTGTTYTKRYDFLAVGVGNEGARPYSGLLRPPAGTLLYGVTQLGGLTNEGALYSVSYSTWDVTVLRNFNPIDGTYPLAELTRATNTFLYGSTTDGGLNNAGTLFSWAVGTSTFTKIKDLVPTDGYSPFGRLMQANNGLLYGITNRGGNNDDGVLFSLNTTGNVYTPLVDLNAVGVTDGWTSLLEDPVGTLYALTNDGGSAGSGALIKYVISTNTLTVAIPMAFSNGSYPKGKLLKASDGKFYGLTSGGGLNEAGVLFSFNPTGNVYTRLVDLGGNLGGSPLGTLVEVSGKLYGVCNDGGASGGGTLFEYVLSTGVFTKKQDLNSTTGRTPLAGLFKAANGKLYGLCSQGGLNNLGTLFDYVPSTNTLTKQHELSSTDGAQPAADLMQANNGLLYGVCSTGGTNNDGTLFSFDTNSNAFSKLFDFTGTDGGSAPSGELVQAPNGKLYGMCADEGSNFYGSIYSWDLTGPGFLEEHPMLGDNTEGSLCQGGLILATDGKLYGACTEGGTGNFGTLFRFTPTGAVFSVLHQFGSVVNNGHYPADGLASDVIPAPPAGVQLALRAALEGPYNTGTGLMNDALRTQPTFPLTEPFTALGFAHVGGGGGETISASVLTANAGTGNAITDWFFVELRSGALPGTVVATKSALLQRDGDVVALDGTSPLTFNVSAGNYRIVARHRNHLGCMTLNEFGLTGSPTTVDLTNGTVPTYGTDGLKIVGAARLMWAGNTFLDTPLRILKYTGSNNDRDLILVRIGGTIPTNTVTGYYQEDCNLDAVVKYTGPANDRDLILVNIGGTIPTATKVEQLP